MYANDTTRLFRFAVIDDDTFVDVAAVQAMLSSFSPDSNVGVKFVWKCPGKRDQYREDDICANGLCACNYTVIMFAVDVISTLHMYLVLQPLSRLGNMGRRMCRCSLFNKGIALALTLTLLGRLHRVKT